MNTLDKILELIAHKKIEQQDFAVQLGLNKRTITDWKSGKSKSYLKYIDKIAAYFNVSTDYLLGNANDPTPPNKKDPPDDLRESQLLRDKLVEIGAIKQGEYLSKEQVNALFDYLKNNKDYVRYIIDKHK